MGEKPEDTFDPDLLNQPWQERVASFEKYISNHRLLREAYERFRSAISIPIPGRIVLVYGPSGVGKTTLRQGVQRRVISEMMPELEKDPGRIPIIGIKVEAPDSGSFDWKKFYKSMLKALDEVLIDQKTNYRVRGVSRDRAGQIIFDNTATKPDLSEAVFSAVEHRKPVAVIADEAQDLGIVKSGRKLQDQMNRIKHLADTLKIPIFLVGTYDLLKFRLLNGQLSRRCVEIHFGRYRIDKDEDVEDFKDILNTFQKKMPLIEEPDLVGRWEYFYDRTLGCVGILKNWLTEALHKSLEMGNETLQDKWLDAFALPMASRGAMLDDILAKEKEIIEAETKEKIDEYRERLRGGPLVEMGAKSRTADKAPEQIVENLKPAASKRKSAPSFRRKPKRDPVGEQKLAS
jgi:GTPase SAR1 family protein